MTQLPTGIVTFLFTDIEGSTRRWEHHREAMSAALPRHDAILRGAIERRGGHVFKTVGDAFYGAFAEIDDALAAALAAQRDLGAEDWSAFGPGFAELRVRMGIHRGHAEARGGDYFGPALNRTARLVSAGHGGQILLSSSARPAAAALESEGLTLRDLGEHRLKDLRHAEHIWQVVAPGLPDLRRPLTTAGELAARDRIVVSDGATPSGSAEGQPTIAERSVAETFDALHQVLRRDLATVVLTTDQLRQAAQHRPADLREYRLGRIAEWSQPHYRLDGRFVALTLLMDQGEDAPGDRWVPAPVRQHDLGALMATLPDPALVVLGPPGGGKSTLLRHLEMDRAIAALREEDGAEGVTFLIQMSQYKPEAAGAAPPPPGAWLAERWAERFPDLPALDSLLAEGRVTLLLDALNEMPVASEREFRERLGGWKDWLLRLTQERPGNRVVFSCRTLDYSAPLSTPALRVPQVQIEALDDAQVHEFLRRYSPVRGEDIWKAIAGTPQLEALRAPFFLALLVDQVEASGELAQDRAGLFTGFVRQALKREVERDNPLFALEELLSSRDLRRLTHWQWQGAYDLPERGALMPKLSGLAYGMQTADAAGGASQLRLDYDRALELLSHDQDETLVKAGVAIGVLDEDPAVDELLYRHQLLQEYFAARVLSRAPQPELVRAPWRAAEIRPSVRELLETLRPADALPALPTTGWEETTILAAAMSAEPEGFIRALMAENLAVAGRAALVPTVASKLSERFQDELRRALLERSRDRDADLRARVEAGFVLGDLGDPRLERRVGPEGAYLLPPMVDLAGGTYPIGEVPSPDFDEDTPGAFVPMRRHSVDLAPFAIGRFSVTNAEYACFMAAGGYEDERWWETEEARAWRRGEGTAETTKRGARTTVAIFKQHPEAPVELRDSGQIDDAIFERFQLRMAMSEAELEAHLSELYPGGRLTEPNWWRDARYNHPAQPVVGLSWFEALAYCAWLSAQTGQAFRLPSEVEWEAAARGRAGRRYAYGEDGDPLKGNLLETRLRRPSPVGIFAEGETPEGLSDFGANSLDWTLSLWGRDASTPEYRSPYVAHDGREDLSVGSEWLRVARGSSFYAGIGRSQPSLRDKSHPDERGDFRGLRLARSRFQAAG
ncbi:MAG: SUMF1/EgtB/PvdO family nonheme iron enzyme [Caldilineae bacterium]|nr:SUMF1/EgtB/PvdO family nonheme iron enzyme [Caldilineae bacterium]